MVTGIGWVVLRSVGSLTGPVSSQSENARGSQSHSRAPSKR